MTEKLNLAELRNQPHGPNYTFEEVMAMPEFAPFHETLRDLQKKPAREIFPKKFAKSMENIATDNAYDFFQKSPKASLNDVISVVMDKLPKDLKPQMLLKLVQITIETWEELTEKAACPKENMLEYA